MSPLLCANRLKTRASKNKPCAPHKPKLRASKLRNLPFEIQRIICSYFEPPTRFYPWQRLRIDSTNDHPNVRGLISARTVFGWTFSVTKTLKQFTKACVIEIDRDGKVTCKDNRLSLQSVRTLVIEREKPRASKEINREIVESLVGTLQRLVGHGGRFDSFQ